MSPGAALPEPDQPNARNAKYTAIPAKTGDPRARKNTSMNRKSPPSTGAIETGELGS
jgi:hypothetical protein